MNAQIASVQQPGGAIVPGLGNPGEIIPFPCKSHPASLDEKMAGKYLNANEPINL